MVVRLPLAIVADGVSAPYGGGSPRLFDGLSGGCMVARAITAELTAFEQRSLREILTAASERVRVIQEQAGLSLVRADQLAGAVFAAVTIASNMVEVIQAGDCFVLWEYSDGSFGMTPNQVWQHDQELGALRGDVMEELASKRGIHLQQATAEERAEIRRISWGGRFHEVRCALRGRDVNQGGDCGFALLNGQRVFLEHCVIRGLPREKLARVLLGSDGIVPWESFGGDAEKVAPELLCAYHSGGLVALLAYVRSLQIPSATNRWKNLPEASAIAIEF